MLDTLIYVMVVLIDTTEIENRFKKEFEEADRQFCIEMMRQASHEAVIETAMNVKKTHRTKVLKIYRKED